MKKITIYSSLICPYCFKAKQILDQCKFNYNEIIVDGDPQLRCQMKKKANGKNTVPQIFFGKKLIGGFDELYTLFQNGKLKDALEIK